MISISLPEETVCVGKQAGVSSPAPRAPPTSGSKASRWWGFGRGAGGPLHETPGFGRLNRAQGSLSQAPPWQQAWLHLCSAEHSTLGSPVPGNGVRPPTLLPFRASILFSNPSGPRASWCPQDTDSPVFQSHRPVGDRLPHMPSLQAARLKNVGSWFRSSHSGPLQNVGLGIRDQQGGLAEGHSSSQGRTPSAVCCPVSRALPSQLQMPSGFLVGHLFLAFEGSFLSDTSGHRREGEGPAAHLQHLWALPLCPGLPASLPPAICASHKPSKGGGR